MMLELTDGYGSVHSGHVHRGHRHRGAWDAARRRAREPAARSPCQPPGRCPLVPRESTQPAVRTGGDGAVGARGGGRVPLGARPWRSETSGLRLAARRAAAPVVPGVRRPHGDGDVRSCRGRPAVSCTDGPNCGHVQRDGVVALSSSAARRLPDPRSRGRGDASHARWPPHEPQGDRGRPTCGRASGLRRRRHPATASGRACSRPFSYPTLDWLGPLIAGPNHRPG